MSFIYKITNTINGKSYIGKTNQTIEIRFNHHIKDRLKPNFKNRPLYRAFLKHGVESFIVEKIEECSVDISSEREIYWIEFYGTYSNGYNATKGGDGTSTLPRDDIVKYYLECGSAAETSVNFGCHSDSVLYVLRENGIIPTRKKGNDRDDTILKEDDVRKILSLYVPKKFGKRKIAKLLNLPLEPVNSVIRGNAWKHLT